MHNNAVADLKCLSRAHERDELREREWNSERAREQESARDLAAQLEEAKQRGLEKEEFAKAENAVNIVCCC